MKKPVIITLVVLLMLVFTVQAFALTADEILDQMEEKRAVNTTQKSVGKMTLSDDKGKEEIRDLVMYSIDDSENPQNRAFIFRFLSPAEVKNVTMLSTKDGDEIYLFMPAFKKVRRIAGSSKKEKFAGTNFSFGDFSVDIQRTIMKRLWPVKTIKIMYWILNPMTLILIIQNSL